MSELTNTQLLSLVTDDSQIKAWFESTTAPDLSADDVLIEVEATPINPSDMPVIFGLTDLDRYEVQGHGLSQRFSMPLPPAATAALGGRAGTPVLTGLEGCGTVVDAGSSPEAQELVGKRVSTFGPGLYARYHIAKAKYCLPLPNNISPVEGASAFVNPLTALGIVDTAKREGHKAMIFTAAASNLGRMVHQLCQQDGLDFIAVVRGNTQVDRLRQLGVKHVCDLSSSDYKDQLIEAIAQTGATLAFDAIGGGNSVSDLLYCMEQVALRDVKIFTRYGAPTHKQVYIYGGLDASPIILNKSYGFSFGVGGWLLFNYLSTCSRQERAALNQRVVDNLTTIFATDYAKAIALEGVLEPNNIDAYMQRGTGNKYLVMPKGLAEL